MSETPDCLSKRHETRARCGFKVLAPNSLKSQSIPPGPKRRLSPRETLLKQSLRLPAPTRNLGFPLDGGPLRNGHKPASLSGKVIAPASMVPKFSAPCLLKQRPVGPPLPCGWNERNFEAFCPGEFTTRLPSRLGRCTGRCWGALGLHSFPLPIAIFFVFGGACFAVDWPCAGARTIGYRPAPIPRIKNIRC